MTITNRYLKKSIEEMSNFLKHNTQPPEDLVFNFVVELRVSSLLIPAVIEDSNISFPHLIGPNAKRILPLFTDDDEFRKYTTDLKAIANEFEYYQHIVNNLEFDGVLINCEGDEFFIDRELINSIPPIEEIEPHGYDALKLKDLAFSVKNEDLLKFIADEDNFNKTAELLNVLNDSVLLNLVISDEDLSGYAFNGIIKRSDVGGFVPLKSRVGLKDYVMLFSDINAAKMHDSGYYQYVQVSNLYEIIRFVLTNDLDGIIINPGREEHYIERHNLILMFDDEDLFNSDLANAVDYAFEI